MHYDINKKIEQLAMCKPARKKSKRKRKSYSLHQEVLSLVGQANAHALPERRVVPRSALAVMNRALASLSSVDSNSRNLAVLREVNKFISLHQDTFKAHSSKTDYADLLPIGHPLCSLNLTVSEKHERERYAAWLAADASISDEARSLVATAYSLEPGSLERRHAFARIEVTRHIVPLFIKFDSIQALVAAYQFRDGNSSAARRARVATQWRDRYGRWVEMGRGLDFKFKLPDGQIGTAAGTYVGIDSTQGFIDFEGKQVANSGFVEVSGHPTLPDGIYSIKSANATPAKARIPQQALKRAKVKTPSATRKATAEESLSPDIPDLQTLLDSRVDAPAGWEKQSDGSYLSDDDYKLIETEQGFALHRLDNDGNTGDKVADVSSWAEAQDAAEKDSAEYDKFKNEIVKIEDQPRGEKPIARLEETDQDKTLIPDGVESQGTLDNGVTYSVEERKQRVEVFPGRYGEVKGVTVTLDGNTYENRKRIKELGFKWNAQDKVWKKNYVDSDLFGKGRNVNRIKEELDGIGGGVMPRYEGDNESIRWHLQDGYNEMIIYSRENKSSKLTEAKEALWDVIQELRNGGPNDRKNASEKLENFIKLLDAPDFPRNERIAVAKRNAQQGIELIAQKEADRGVVPQEAPEVPKSESGVPTKTPTDVTPTSPKLFDQFDAPDGAFKLRTVEYEPVGREDQESRNYTDDPERLATRYPLTTLVRALTESVVGEKDNSIMDKIVQDIVDSDDEALDLEEAYDVAETPAIQAGRANATGAGKLEFDAGEEFVPAEALYNAVFLAGGDPNRVIANAYDAIHGDRRNAEKLNNASGELPSQEEQELIDDMMQEIRQIEDSRENGEAPISNIADEPDQESDLTGELIYNNPIDWDNPDYHVLDPNAYEPTVPEVDENGYSDDPKYIARNFEQADLIQQLTSGITDGSGSAYFRFNDDDYMDGTFEVPVEAIRDALQYQGVNTNTLLEDLKRESNDFSEGEKPEPTPEPTPEPEPEVTPEPEAPSAEASWENAIDAIEAHYTWLPNDLSFIAYLPADGSIAFSDVWDDTKIYIARPDRSIVDANVTEEWLLDPNGAGQAGWRKLTEDEIRSIYASRRESEDEQEAPAAAEAPAPAAPAAPQYQYPGPRERGYSPNNTTIVRGGAVVGRGARVQAVKDGKVGTVVAIQNDPEYLRIKFDDGTTAVRAAAKVRSVSNANGAAPQVVQAEPQPPVRDVTERLDAPKADAPRLARSGETVGVNDESTVPEYITGLTNENAVQSDFSAWGTRDAEIAKAARDRISLENLQKELAAFAQIDPANDAEFRTARDRITSIMGDIYGARNGITFGGEFFSLTAKYTNVSAVAPDAEWRKATKEDIENGKATYSIETVLEIRDVTGNKVGDIRRTLTLRKNVDQNGNVVGTDMYAKNDYLALSGGGKKKGFATAFNRYTENWYIANGIEKVKVYAAGGAQYQGGFVWALNGFNWDPKEGAPGVAISDFQRAVTNKEEERQVEVIKEKLKAAKLPNGKYDYSKLPTPLEYALIGWKPGATDWLGKRVMIRESWNGVKHLTPTSREQVQAANYNQVKNAERRIDSKQNIPNVSSDGLAAVNSDGFRNNSNIAPYYEEIRDALRNNRSLAVLSPAAKVALNNYVSEQLLDKNRSLPLEDAFRLRTGLSNEYRADYGYSDPFNSAEVLSNFTVEAFFEAADKFGSGNADIDAAGFKVRQLTGFESGVNATFEVTHTPSGQVFYVKNDEFVSNFSDTPAGVTELEASLVLRAAGMQGIHEVRVGRNDRNLIVMSRAGSIIPLVDEAKNAGSVFRNGIKDPKGTNRTFSEPSDFIEALDTPEDLIRMSILDILGNNQDRHNGNWMLAYDKTTGKLRVFPVDNTVGELRTQGDAMAEFINYGSLSEADVYNDYMPALIDRVSPEGIMKIYENEISNIINNLDNPLYQPRGFEMDKIIDKWGSYDAFKDAMTERLKKLATKGTDEYEALKGAMTIRYWN